VNMHISDPQARFLVQVYAQLQPHLASAVELASTSACGSLITATMLPGLLDAASQALVHLMYAEHPSEAARVLAARQRKEPDRAE
jgi:hypothetical protein